MKLLRFSLPPAPGIHFGVCLGEQVVSFADLCGAFDAPAAPLNDLQAYLQGLPDTALQARQLLAQAQMTPQRLPEGRCHPLSAVRLHAPVARPAALFDFALSPRHFRNSARTLMHHEMPRAVRGLAQAIAARRYARPLRYEDIRAFLADPQQVSGPDDEIPWPAYSAYLDIEPELAVLTTALPRGAGKAQRQAAIAGYLIFNDWSARDVQYPEMSTGTLGFLRAKHFEAGNGLGPYLVTPDELADPYALEVRVDIGGRLQWSGNTREYAFRAEDALARLLELAPIASGSVVALGTVPDCCGLDNNQWLRPGETVQIRIDGLGTLRQRAGIPAAGLPTSRWAARDDVSE